MEVRSKFDWIQARSFLATVQEGSFSAAARQLGLTQPTLSRHITALEAQLGLTLFEKLGHKLILTPAGAAILPHIEQMESAAQSVERVAFGQSQDMRGPVVITAEDLFAAKLLPVLIHRIQARSPMLELNIVADNDRRDLQRREADIAIRYSRPEEPELIARRLPDGVGVYYASKEYLRQIGLLNAGSDLSGVSFISIDPEWEQFLLGQGLNVTKENITLTTSHHGVMWDMVQAGLGIGPCDTRIAARTDNVVQVLCDLPPLPFPNWLVVHRDVRSNPAVRMVYDLLAEEIPKL